MNKKLSSEFYARDNVAAIARDLLGKVLCTRYNGVLTSGMIVETEAYSGTNDKACHSCVHGMTERTRIMFGKPGYAYIYLCYGIHHLFNVVTNVEGKADAVLVRAIEPLEGIDIILTRRNKKKLERSVGGGPGIVGQALGITTNSYGESLQGETIWIENRNLVIPSSEIITDARIGVDYAGDDAKKPWRFRIKNNPYTSTPG